MSKKKMTYEEAYKELQDIYAKIESGETSIDHIADQVQRAGELIGYCKEKLRKSEQELNQISMNADNP